MNHVWNPKCVRRKTASVAFSITLALSLAPAIVEATVLPAGFTEQPFVGGLTFPTAMAAAPDGRIFVCEQGGKLRVIKNGALLATPFVTVAAHFDGEQGLLGVAFDPSFPANGYIYVYYTSMRRVDGTTDLHHRVSRFTAAGDVAVAGSERVLLEILDDNPEAWHNGGALRFSFDGKLLIAVGDRSQPQMARDTRNLQGKLLRMNPDGTIPTDNPFYSTAVGINRLIWAIGLRNPFTFDVQPGTGRVFINDVGGQQWEEINEGAPGADFGWNASEGPTTLPGHTTPFYAYSSAGAVPCSIVGAAFYNPPTVTFPNEYVDRFFFADHCGRWIRALDPATKAVTTFATDTDEQLVDLEVGTDGALYYLSRGSAAVRRIVYTGGGGAPSITTQPADQTITVGQPVTFSVVASGATPLTYQWQRNGVDIPGATTSTYRINAVATGDNGARFRCRVSNPNGSTNSREAVLTVTTNTAPRATILMPGDGLLYSGGNRINFVGSASDQEDGSLPATAFTWRVDFHHDTHTHPHLPPASGSTSGSFTVPTTGETSTNVWYRIHLTVTDSGGLTGSTYRDVLPRVARITLATDPAGLSVSLDGQTPQTSPLVFDAVAGMTRAIGTSAAQMMGGRTWQFVAWSDNGAISHDITIPETARTYTATFADAEGGPTPTPTATPTGPTATPPPTATPTPSGPVRYEQGHAAAVYKGTWFTNSNGAHSGGSAALAMDVGSDVTFTFNGTGVRWIGARDAWAGQADVFLDGALVGRIDTYSPTGQHQHVIYANTSLASGGHTLRIVVTGTRHASSGGAWVWIDAFEVIGGSAGTPTPTATPTPTSAPTATPTTAPPTSTPTSTPTPTGTPTPTPTPDVVPPTPTPTTPPSTSGRYEQNDPAARYTGTWFTHSKPTHSGGTAVLAMDAGHEVTFTFNGTGVKWIAFRDEWSGMADVYIDGVLKGRVDTYASPARSQDIVDATTGLPDGPHTLRIVVTGTRRAASGGSWVWIDAFDVIGAPATPTATPTASPTVAPTATPTTAPTATPTAPTATPTSTPVAPTPTPTVAPTMTPTPTPAPTATPTPTAAPRTTPTPTPVPVSTRYEQNQAAVAYTGPWFTQTNAVHSGGGATLAMDAGSEAVFTFSGTAVSWIGVRDPWAGQADVYLDGAFKGRIDTYSAVEQTRAVLYNATGLPAGTHTLRIVVPGTRNAASGGAWVWIDAFDVVSSSPTP